MGLLGISGHLGYSRYLGYWGCWWVLQVLGGLETRYILNPFPPRPSGAWKEVAVAGRTYRSPCPQQALEKQDATFRPQINQTSKEIIQLQQQMPQYSDRQSETTGR